MASAGTRNNSDSDDGIRGAESRLTLASFLVPFSHLKEMRLSLPLSSFLAFWLRSSGVSFPYPCEDRWVDCVVVALVRLAQEVCSQDCKLSASGATRKLKEGVISKRKRTRNPLKAAMLSPAAHENRIWDDKLWPFGVGRTCATWPRPLVGDLLGA